jgi:hypothetical protein
MNIGFDLDKIFIDYPLFVPDVLINTLYKQKSNGVLLYRIPSRVERSLRILTHYPFFRPPIISNIQFVEDLAKSKKHKHYLISSRFSFLKHQTELIVNKYKLGKIFDAMFFNFKDQQPHIFKDQVIKKMKITLYVDDDLPLLEYLADKNPKVRFFWLNTMQNKKLGKNLFAIKNLSEMFSNRIHLRGVAPQHLGGGPLRPPRLPSRRDEADGEAGSEASRKDSSEVSSRQP